MYNIPLEFWKKAQLLLSTSAKFMENADNNNAYNDLFFQRSAKDMFNNLNQDRDLYRSHMISKYYLVSESNLVDLVNAETDLSYLRTRTPELDSYALEYRKSILSHRNKMRKFGIDLPIDNDHMMVSRAEMTLRRSYLYRLWHNSLHAMHELNLEIPNWTKILPYTPLVNAINGMNPDDEAIGKNLLSILKNENPEIYLEIIESNPFKSPLIGYTVGLGNIKFTIIPTMSEITSSLESNIAIDPLWEKKYISGYIFSDDITEYDLEVVNDDLIELYAKLNLESLRREADNLEINNAFTMDRSELLKVLEINLNKRKNIFSIPKISRLSDWTLFAKNLSPNEKKDFIKTQIRRD